MVRLFPTDLPSEPAAFELDLDLRRGLIKPRSDLTGHYALLALTAVQTVRTTRPGDLVIDLTDVNAIGLPALDAIGAIARAQHGAGLSFVLVGAKFALKRLLFAHGLSALLRA